MTCLSASKQRPKAAVSAARSLLTRCFGLQQKLQVGSRHAPIAAVKGAKAGWRGLAIHEDRQQHPDHTKQEEDGRILPKQGHGSHDCEDD